MAGHQDLSVFECCVIVAARKMGHSIFEEAMKYEFSRTTISRVCHEYRESGKTSILRHRCGWKKNMQEQDQQLLTRLITSERRAVLQQIDVEFIAGPSPYCEPFNEA
ncbi:ATP-dependent DNA helicase [Trichonephila clavipes]|nr:ATP-dependent DNA helicase [Trichonephila clavipes]